VLASRLTSVFDGTNNGLVETASINEHIAEARLKKIVAFTREGATGELICATPRNLKNIEQ